MKWKNVKQDSDKWYAQDSRKDDYALWREELDRQHQAHRKFLGWVEINEPELIERKFVSGLGLVNVVVCPQCGGESEQYNTRYNPARFCCKSCHTELEKTGSLWEKKAGVQK